METVYYVSGYILFWILRLGLLAFILYLWYETFVSAKAYFKQYVDGKPVKVSFKTRFKQLNLFGRITLFGAIILDAIAWWTLFI